MENHIEVPQKTKNRVAYDPAIPLWGIYPDKTETCTPMFIAVLFTIVKTWKQPKCLLTDEGIEKMWYMHVCVHVWGGCICVYI